MICRMILVLTSSWRATDDKSRSERHEKFHIKRKKRILYTPSMSKVSGEISGFYLICNILRT